LLRLERASKGFFRTLLNGAKGESTETPKPQPKQSPSSEAKPQSSDQISSPTVAASIQSETTPTATICCAKTEAYYYPPKDSWDWPGIVEAISTLGLLLFAGWQMGFVRQSTKSMNVAAMAAREAADTAERALSHAERAWLAFEIVDIQGLNYVRARIERLFPTLREPVDSPTVEIIKMRVSYRLNNCGRTPARLVAEDIQFICADPTSLPQEPVYSRKEAPESLMPPGLSATNSRTVDLYPP
jgi:hypothetical protein